MDFLTSSHRPPFGSTFNPDALTKIAKETYNQIFVDRGRSPDSYLNAADIGPYTNDSVFNSTFDSNSSSIADASEKTYTAANEEDVAELVGMAVTSIVLGLMILITVIGNVFVIAAIILERNLQNVANYLVASLAVADLLVACLVMPLGAVYEISKGWILGPELCDIWTSCDVLCCTASILHLVAIAIDRYWAVTNVDYIHSRTSGRVLLMIFLVWIVAVIVSLAPQFGWKDPEYLERIQQQRCMVSQDIGYQIFATCSTFYVPLFVILVLYWKIYQTARKRIHRRRPKQVVAANNNQVVIQTSKSKPKSRLRFRLASRFSSQEKSVISSMGLVEGNSTNTVNTVGDTTDESSNEKKGIEIVTTTFCNSNDKEGPTSSKSDIISTVSHQVDTTKNSNATSMNNHPAVDEQTAMNTAHNATVTTPTVATTLSPAPSVMQNQLASTPSSPANQQHTRNNGGDHKESTAIQQHQSQQQYVPTGGIANPHTQVRSRKETLEAKRERKAAKTLAIITGAFVVCWLPFFLMALILPLCGETCSINDKIAALFLWLGYFNSTLNPVIYTIFSPEFRQAFKRILFGTHRTAYYRGGKL